ATFADITLEDYLTEQDGDDVSWSYEFLSTQGEDFDPNWSVNPNDFSLQMNFTAQVVSKGNIATGAINTLGAFVGDECRGTAHGLFQMDKWVYYLTVYANENSEEITFRFFDNNMNQNLPIEQTYTFISNDAQGSLPSPIQFIATNLIVDIDNQNIVSITLLDSDWTGSEDVRFTATDANTSNNFSDFDDVEFGINATDHTPLISEIPDQEIENGDSFANITLGDYLTEVDGDNVEWSYSGNVNISVEIVDGIASFTYQEDWIGSETIRLTVTDQTDNGFSSFEDILFTVNPVDHEPILADIPDQIIGNGVSFSDLYLQEYLTELDEDEVVWDYTFGIYGETVIYPEWNVIPANYELSMNVIAEVTSKGNPAESENHYLAAFVGEECRGVTQAVYYQAFEAWIYSLTVYADNNGEDVTLRFYDATFEQNIPVVENFEFTGNDVLGEFLNPYQVHAHFLNIDIDAEGIAVVSMVDPNWIGEELVEFSVTDVDTDNSYSDSVDVIFQKINAEPPVADNQDLVLDEDNDLDIVLTGSTNEGTLTYFISRYPEHGTLSGSAPDVIYSPNLDYYGTDSFEFIANNGITNSNSATISLTVNAINDFPVNTTIPLISGNLFVNNELSVTNGIWNDDKDNPQDVRYLFNPTFSYQWYFSGDNNIFATINNATSSTFTIPDTYYDNYVKCEVICVDDGEGLPASQSTSVYSDAVYILNTQPQFVFEEEGYIDGNTINLTEDEDVEIQFILTAIDDNANQTFMWEAVQLQHCEIAINSIVRENSQQEKQIVFTPTLNYFGTAEFSIIISDNAESSAQLNFSITVYPVNDAPIIELPVTYSFDEDTTPVVDFTEYITDIDPNDNLTLTAVNGANISV
ncbi:MAG: Ig-like domain-containing protein, partial [Candidatus Cloacimonadota bacterium]|nr:Ig-like domain-containing protein [Candidatus Cloacimonadota bacterium]